MPDFKSPPDNPKHVWIPVKPDGFEALQQRVPYQTEAFVALLIAGLRRGAEVTFFLDDE